MGKAIGDLEIFLSIILHLQNVSTIYQEMERDGEHIQKKSLSMYTLAGILKFCPKIINLIMSNMIQYVNNMHFLLEMVKTSIPLIECLLL